MTSEFFMVLRHKFIICRWNILQQSHWNGFLTLSVNNDNLVFNWAWNLTTRVRVTHPLLPSQFKSRADQSYKYMASNENCPRENSLIAVVLLRGIDIFFIFFYCKYFPFYIQFSYSYLLVLGVYFFSHSTRLSKSFAPKYILFSFVN